MQNELIVIEREGLFVVDSRDVAIMVEKEHKDLLESIRNYIQYLLSGKFRPSDFFVEHSYQDTLNRLKPCYLLTKKGCDMIANKMTGEKGVLFTATYVTKFEEMENKLKQSTLPSNYLEALKSLVQSEEEKLKLKAENESNKILIEEMKPKVEFTDRLLKSKDNLLIREYSKVLQNEGFTLGEKKLYQWLRNNKYLMQNNEPYQNYMKYFVVKEVAINTQYGIKLNNTTKINPEGQLYIYKKLKQDGMLV